MKDRRGNWENVMSWEIKREGLEIFGKGSENMEGLKKEERKRKRRNKQKQLIRGLWVLAVSYLEHERASVQSMVSTRFLVPKN